MKRAVSVSLGSSRRDKTVEVELLGENIRLERIGTDGDFEKAARLFRELDGRVDAFGLGGTDLGFRVGRRWYPLHSVRSIVRFVTQTPLVDGGGLKATLESRVVPVLEREIGRLLSDRKVLLTSGIDRWGLARSFADGGYRCVFGDLMFALGLPLPLRSLRSVAGLATVLMPVISRLPFRWIYPTGEKQERSKPKWARYFRWATVVAGDCQYIKRHMPADLKAKVVVTNSTTAEDRERFRAAGVRYLVTTTPVLEGRSFGTNMIEAALVAVAGRPLPADDLGRLIERIGIEPQVMELN
jgi:hypothetical protein